MLPGRGRISLHALAHACFLSWICTMYADPAQYRYLAWAGWDVDDLDHDMSDAWKPRIDIFFLFISIVSKSDYRSMTSVASRFMKGG